MSTHRTVLERKFRGKDLAEMLQDEKKLASVYRRLRTAGYSTGNSVKVLKRYAAAHGDHLDALEDSSAQEEESAS